MTSSRMEPRRRLITGTDSGEPGSAVGDASDASDAFPSAPNLIIICTFRFAFAIFKLWCLRNALVTTSLAERISVNSFLQRHPRSLA
eukprot:CAMPEP_0182580524 /NCGR_PEP_ID=MMETSP1324-20130603/47358_1 /TAXON_ID=236786 /ORGANISM="Florenciella sp., Strain RCC1587" /LENGTH=86 /DNA_ID=CAMNT_0024796775 /DNA_START=63 /DNA_END=323 /DNA_ORIENTATION=+